MDLIIAKGSTLESLRSKKNALEQCRLYGHQESTLTGQNLINNFEIHRDTMYSHVYL